MKKSEDTPRTNCAIYVRTARLDQTLGNAADDQIQECRQFAERLGWALADDHVYVDIGVSGLSAVEQRPALARLVEAVRPQGRDFDVVLVSSTDRLGRSMADMLRLLKALWKCGVPAVAVNPFAFDVLKMLTTAER